MPVLPPESTARYKVTYQQGPYEHSFQVRVTGNVSPATFGTWLDGFLGGLGTAVNTLQVTGVEFAGDGQTIFNPVAVAGLAGSYGGGTVNAENAPRYLDFVGRSTGGKRVRLAVFGYQGPTSDYRVTDGEDPHVADAIDRLNAESNIGVAIDGIKAIWKPYANMGWNAHWQRALRA